MSSYSSRIKGKRNISDLTTHLSFGQKPLACWHIDLKKNGDIYIQSRYCGCKVEIMFPCARHKSFCNGLPNLFQCCHLCNNSQVQFRYSHYL